MSNNTIMRMENISKRFDAIQALDHVHFDLKRGEVHALVGENGAGKSTLIKSISGAIPFNEGSIIIDGVEYTHMDPILSRSLGIEVIYQEFNLMPSMTVAENSVRKERPNTVMPGVRCPISNSGTGILA